MIVACISFLKILSNKLVAGVAIVALVALAWVDSNLSEN
jgi:hypothetical protein